MDALTEVLKAIQLYSTVHCRSEFSAPWGLQIDKSENAAFHVILQGKCWLELSNLDTPIPLTSGDLVVFPTTIEHTLRDALDSPVTKLTDLLENCPYVEPLTLSYGGGGTPTVVLCGDAWFEEKETNPLLTALPPIILIKGEQGRAVEWLDATLQFIACESSSNRPGAKMMITHLSSILFIQAVRGYLASLSEGEGGWLGALLDPQISIVLGLIHQHPEKPWTVELLARQVNLSRSAFAAKFKMLVGESPLQYITRWRMHKAARLLRYGYLNLAEISSQVGYESEAAFSKAFKRQIGKPPGEYRRDYTFQRGVPKNLS
jgi:AraC-like DNA-binding protein